MACDSCWTCGDTVDTLATKIDRLRSGALLGSAGDNDGRTVRGLFETVRTSKQIPPRESLLAIRCDYMGLLVLPDGKIFKISTTLIHPDHFDQAFQETADDVGVWETNSLFAAIGSGSSFALAAMEAGMDARAAVRIACKYDIHSRPPIYSMSLVQKKFGRVLTKNRARAS